MKGHTLPGIKQRATDPGAKKTQDNLNKNIHHHPNLKYG